MSVLEDLLDAFRNIIPYYFVLIVPLLILISPLDPVKAAQHFTAYRLQQYDVQGVKLGSRSSAFNFEAQTSSSKLLTRKCLLLKIMEVSAASIKLAISQNVGSIICLLPHKHQWDNVVKEHISNLEKELLMDNFPIPIYFTFETEEVQNIYFNVQQLMETSKSSSAAQALISSVMTNGYQLYTSSINKVNQAIPDFQITNFYGKLSGNGIEEQLPTVLIVAHYDSMGMAPSLSFGYDSNGSGMVSMFQLMRLFSRLYSSQKTQAKYNLAFLLTGGGKLNYIGTKKWLEELHEDGTVTPDRMAAVLCLERLGFRDEGLFSHVSKPPKEGSTGHWIVEALNYSMNVLNSTSSVIHKRINLNEDELQWEHERFSLRKIPAFTLSGEKDRANNRRSILDDSVSIPVLARNTRAIADALVRVLYGLDDGDNEMVIEDHWVSDEAIRADLSLVTRFPRSQQLIDVKHPLLLSLDRIFNRYLQNVRRSKIRADPRDPEFLFYTDTEEVSITAHRVKPALFDFMVACAILIYLGLVYLFIEYFSVISCFLLKITMVQLKQRKEKQI